MIFVMEMCCVFFEVGAELLCIIEINFVLQRLKCFIKYPPHRKLFQVKVINLNVV
jgi:hypothetical protein